jgi:PAS domain S-box-containing protein
MSRERSKSRGFFWSLIQQYKFSGAVLLIGVVGVWTGAFLIQDIQRAMEEAQQIYARSVRGLDLIGELQYQTQEARRNIIYALTTADSSIQKYYVDQSREADTQVNRIIREHNTLLREPEEVMASQTFERNWSIYLSIRDEVIDLILEGNTPQAVRLDLNAGVNSFNAVSADLRRIKQLYDEQAQHRLADLKQAFNLSFLKIGVMLALILLLVAGAVTFLERGKRLRAIQQSEARLNAVVESINDGMFVVGHNGRVELVNQTAKQRWGRTDASMLGKDLSEIIPELKDTVIPQTILECVKTGRVATVQNLKLKNDQLARIYEARLFPFVNGTTVFFNDVTERQQAEDERLRLSKLESIGLLAGGIAHDFNNIMTGVLGYISFAKLDLPPDSPVYGRLSEAEQAAIEAKNLTQQLLTFSKGGAPVKERIDIPSLLMESVSFVLRGSNVRCAWDLPEDLWPVHVDTGQMKQVVHNLAINAIQAMPDGGTLTIRGVNLILGSSTQIKGKTLSPGFYVKLTFADEGIGMAPEQLDSIFDPYFTTKPNGTGLGLTTVYTIISRHDGAITVDAAPQEGATFEIYLPAATQTADQETTAYTPDHVPAQRAEGKILIMDDETIIRELAAKSLTQYGFRIQTAGSGDEAVALYRRSMDQGEPFDVVLVDLAAPGRTEGIETIRSLKRIHPTVKTVVSSAYNSPATVTSYKELGVYGVVSKPYRVQELFKTIQDVIGRSEPLPHPPLS